MSKVTAIKCKELVKEFEQRFYGANDPKVLDMSVFLFHALEEMADTAREEAVKGIIDAWTNEGFSPHYHQEQKALLGRKWPTLYREIVKLKSQSDEEKVK